MPYLAKNQITEQIIPIILVAMKDEIPNVRFSVSKLIHKQRQYIDQNVFAAQLAGPLKEHLQDGDKDVQNYALLALQG